MDIAGRTVAVTGAGSGIGAALAIAAAQRGAAAVAVLDINLEAAEDTASRIREHGVASAAFACDVADLAQTERVAAEVVDTLGVPGLVCANAGVNTPATALLDGNLGDLQWALSVNVIGTWATIKSFGQHLRSSSEPGWFLVTASEHAVGVPFAGNGFYTASKHAVLGLSDVLRRELPAHLGVSVMIPGLAATGLWQSGALRPADYGGPLPATEAENRIIARGMDPDLVASRALDGVADERFLIATHHHVRDYSDERAADIAAAFEALDPGDDPSFDLATVIAAMRSKRSERT
ncbi:SDR family NAD(P)-dependent oxidoreductase [Mycobacterium sp. NBC_00419]|uniref:SDR family NAD(P)-dependent oxidoreductase n=1 Tax=Mycobacterium sp. NBC_00419 TaxID=2975989 RepID=UPI002E1C5F2E